MSISEGTFSFHGDRVLEDEMLQMMNTLLWLQRPGRSSEQPRD